MQQQVVSKQRVADHGEVLTHQREVDAMLDLVKSETERIDSSFLEPACGNGNFLKAILERKLRVVEKRYDRSALECERYAVLAVSSIYGIDILEDNVVQCRQRLFALVEGGFNNLFGDGFLGTVRFILERNIIWGDALSLQTVGENPQPIIFSEWKPFNGSMIIRKDFAFHELLSFGGTKEKPLFNELGEERFFPEPIREYPPTHYLRLADAEAS